jgi:hypothetical protein
MTRKQIHIESLNRISRVGDYTVRGACYAKE